MALIETYRGYVSLAECDEMGHMNIQHYLGKTSDASFQMRAALGIGKAYAASERGTYVALEHHIRFHRELHASDLVAVEAGIADLRDRTATLYQELRNLLTGALAATFVVEIGHLDLETRRLRPWPEAMGEKAGALGCTIPDAARPRALSAEAFDREISLEEATTRGMPVTNRSAVNAWECDTNGHMNARFYLARISDVQGHLWALAGLDRHRQIEDGLGTATLELRIAYLRELMAGDVLVIHTDLEPAGAKTLKYRHWFFDAETGAPVAAAEGIGVTFARETRRAGPLPERVRDRLAARKFVYGERS